MGALPEAVEHMREIRDELRAALEAARQRQPRDRDDGAVELPGRRVERFPIVFIPAGPGFS